MTGEGDGALSPGKRRRQLIVPLLRSAGSATLLTVLYYVAPLDRSFGVGTTVILVVGLLAFGGLVAWQAVAIAASEHPRLRAIEAFSTAVPLFLLLFSAAYFVMARETESAFNEPLNRTDALYFTVTVFATVGLGDVAPSSQPARVLTTVQMIAGLILVGLVAKVLFQAVQIGLERQDSRSRQQDREP